METKHTPGPWIAQNHYVVTDRHERLEVIAVVGGRETLNFACDPADLENTANAALIAAAPEMERALLLALPTLHQVCIDDPQNLAAKNVIRMIDAALAKAEGRDQ